MLLFALHLSLLILIAAFFLRDLPALPTPDLKLFAGTILIWSSLIFAACILSCWNLFGNNGAYGILTVFLMLLLSFLMRRSFLSVHSPPASRPISAREWLRINFHSWPKKLAGLIFILLCGMLLCLLLGSPLQIPDTLGMKLPNAYFYLQSGNLLPQTHFSDDGRLFSTPFNGSIFWAYLIRWRASDQLILFFNFLFYLFMTAVVYRLCRVLNSSRWAALTASLLFAFSLSMLGQAASDNDDLMSALPAAMGCVFLLRWVASIALADLILAALGFGISLGAKLTPGLYFPAVLLLIMYFIFSRRWDELKIRFKQSILGGIIGLTLLIPFALARWIGTGHFGYMTPMLKISENSPFRWMVAIHNVIVYNLQLFLSPIPDLIVLKIGHFREHLVDSFNEFLVGNFVPKVENVFAYVPGVHISYSQLYENTVWYGTFAWLVGAALIWVLFAKKWRYQTPFWLAIFFICWDLLFCFRSKYIEELGRYWILPIAFVCPLVALFWDQFGAKNRVIRFLFIFVWTSMAFTGVYEVLLNPIRYNVRQVLKHEIRLQILSSDTRDLLRSCNSNPINILGSVYCYPLSTLMREYEGKQLSYFQSIQSGKINIVPALPINVANPNFVNKHVLIDLQADRQGGFKDLHNVAHSIPLYASAESPCTCAESCPKTNSFLIAQLQADTSSPTSGLPTDIRILDNSLRSQFQYRVMTLPERVLVDWTDQTDFKVIIPSGTEKLMIDAREREDSSKIFTGFVPVAMGK